MPVLPVAAGQENVSLYIQPQVSDAPGQCFLSELRLVLLA